MAEPAVDSTGAVPLPGYRPEPRWPKAVALAVAIGLYVVLPQALIIGPRWLVPALEALLVVPILVTRPFRRPDEEQWLRVVAVADIAVINVANIVSVVLLVHKLVRGTPVEARALVYSAILIWLTNVIVFGLWFWELDRGGPGKRGTSAEALPDFQFPQMATPQMAPPNWRPSFVDYLYVAFTNATAFSPTDAMPLTTWAKSLMTVESLVSVVTVVVVAARAINILN